VARVEISALMQVHNEEKCLPCSLAGLLPAVDELIVIDGSDVGTSTDRSEEVISDFSRRYPGKIRVFSGQRNAGIFVRADDGVWDEPKQINIGYDEASYEYIMRTHADIIYDTDDVMMIRDIIERYPDKKYFYCPHIEFCCDTNHILLSSHVAAEECLPRHLCGDVAVISKRTNPRFEFLGNYRRAALTADIDWRKDIIFMPHVKRFHYAYVKPFKDQVLKVVKYIKKGDWEADGVALLESGEAAIYKRAVEFVLGFQSSPHKYDYAGLYPKAGEPLRDMKMSDGQEEFMVWYHEEFPDG
jgi:glycosyltransferase involved in cell wall biosynthesis